MVPVRSVLFAVRQPLISVASVMAIVLFALPVSPGAQDIPATQTTAPPTQTTAQPDFSNDVPAHIAVVEGKASLERDGNITAVEENAPLLAGDRLRTDDGRIEILFADGSVLDIDKYAAIDLLSDSLMRLRAGRIRLSIVRVSETLEYRIDGAGATTTIRTAGEYRVAVLSPRSTEPTMELAVLQGTADLSTNAGRTAVRAGQRAFGSERTQPSRAEPFNSTSQTDFDRWCEELRDARLGAVSTQYLPSELRYYSGAFDNGGDWRYEQSYGYVWYPHVATTWQPYYYGNWSVVGSFGWFWVGAGSWNWPTHHYGWWGFNNGWYWIPGRHWGPAWVSWGYSPGYVGWCPRPYYGYAAYGAQYSRGWTTVPSRSFTAGVAVSRHAVNTPGDKNFSVRSSGPTATGAVARTRSGEPLRSPTGRRVDSSRSDTGSPMNSPRAVSRTGSVPPSSTSTPSTSPRTARGSRDVVQPTDPTRADAAGRAVSRSRTPVTPDVQNQPQAGRTPADSARSRVYSSSRPPSDSSATASPRSRVIAPQSQSGPAPYSGSQGSQGSRRAAPPSSSGGSDRPGPSGPSGPPSVSRAAPRSMPSGPPPSAGGGSPPSSGSPRSRSGGSTQSAPPRSSSSPPSSASSPRSSSGSSSGSGGASPRTGRGGGR